MWNPKMSPRTQNQSAKSQEQALAAFVSQKAEIDALARAVSDAEAERWLEDAVDRSLYSPPQAHYTEAPIFDPPELDPVPVRSGWWWRRVNADT
jgi:hypothetical protein